MHDPGTLVWSFRGLIQIWHEDPCTDGSDDSCGWFMRARHGDKAVLEKIITRFEFDWDRLYIPDREDHDESEDGPYRPNVYFRGYFTPDGDPHMSVHGIVLNLFLIAAGVVFEKNGRVDDWKKSRRFMREYLFDILMFAENPTDSLFDALNRTFEIGCGEKHTENSRKERIRSMASCIYAWILRETRPWYREPRWHLHHWQIRLPFLQRLWFRIASPART